ERSSQRPGVRYQARRFQRISGRGYHRIVPARTGSAEAVAVAGIVDPGPASPTPATRVMKHRQLRVNELLRRELSGIITRELSFDEALVTINQVDVTPDLKNAHVYVSVLGNKSENVIEELEAPRVALQAALARH